MAAGLRWPAFRWDVADVVTFFLFDDMKVLQSLIAQEDVFHALRFK